MVSSKLPTWWVNSGPPITEVTISLSKKNVQPLYVTPGKDEINIKIYEEVDFKDKVMSLHFAGNKKTGKGDLNAMSNALEVVSAKPVDPKKKLTSQWAKIKKDRS